jgi:hypothetical protein
MTSVLCKSELFLMLISSIFCAGVWEEVAIGMISYLDPVQKNLKTTGTAFTK